MKPNPLTASYRFLAGGGKMGLLMRSGDWSATVVGTPDTWPLPLRTTVGMVLTAHVPMLLCWGPDRIAFYNDAFRDRIDPSGQFDTFPGQSTTQVWPHFWQVNQPHIESVFALNEGAFLDRYTYRRGTTDESWALSYSPIRNEHDEVAGVLITATDLQISPPTELTPQPRPAVFDSAQIGISLLSPIRDAQGAIVDFVYNQTNWAPESIRAGSDLTGERFLAIHHSPELLGLFDVLREVAEAGESRRLVFRYQAYGTESWYDTAILYRNNELILVFHDVTQQAEAHRQLERSALFVQSVIEQSPVAKAVFIGDSMEIQIANARMLALLGHDSSIIGKRPEEALPESISASTQAVLQQVYQQGQLLHQREVPYAYVKNGVTRIEYHNLTFQPLRDPQGTIYGVLMSALNVTDQVLTRQTEQVAQQALAESEERLRFALEAAQLGVWNLDPVTNLINWDNRSKGLFGIADNQPYTYEQAVQFIHPDDRAGVDEAVHKAMDPQHDGTYDMTYRTVGASDGVVRWVRFMGRGYFNASGQVYRFAGIAQNVTDQIMARQHIEESQRQLLDSFEQAPVGIALLHSDPQLTFRMVNPFYAQLVGRTPEELAGKPLLEALPELQGQGFDELLRNVIETGEAYVAHEMSARVVRNDRLETIYVDLSYHPQRGIQGGTDPAGAAPNAVTGILVVATDVTQQVNARQRIEASERRFRQLIEDAPVAIALYMGPDLVIEYSNERMQKLWGKGEYVNGMLLHEALPELDGQPFIELLNEVYRTGVPYHASKDRADLVVDGKLSSFYFNFTYEPLRDENGQIYAILNVATDVSEQVLAQQQVEASETRYRELSLELDERVQQRTHELNEINKELERSNRNLEQFAYVASHDLQEPLRKIQSFGDILKNQYADQLGPGADFINRMQSAATRMSILIKDLLLFSRLSTRQEPALPVDLNRIAARVLDDLSLTIEETGAQVTIGSLPTVLGDGSQLGQLFQNLLTNAIKFRRPNTAPHINIRSERVALRDLPAHLKPARQADWYECIRVTDNGIGFENKYTDRIFQVFQRLHGKHEFAGTGIGLAICEKVALNHGGAITARSQPGEGATFLVYLPALG